MSRECEYTLKETIDALDGWANRGQRMFAIDAALSAVHYLQDAPLKLDDDNRAGGFGLWITFAALRSWLKNEESEIPTQLALATLHWCRMLAAHRWRVAEVKESK